MPTKKWARPRQSGAYGLRRGAWYLVVNDSGGSLVILSVRRHNVPVPRAMLDFSDEEPNRWSIVRWEEDHRGIQRASEQSLGLTYAVCPDCDARAPLAPEGAASMTCPECRGTFEIDWEHLC